MRARPSRALLGLVISLFWKSHQYRRGRIIRPLTRAARKKFGLMSLANGNSRFHSNQPESPLNPGFAPVSGSVSVNSMGLCCNALLGPYAK